MEWTPFLDTFLVLFVFLRGRGVMWRTLSEYPRRAWVDLFEQGLEVTACARRFDLMHGVVEVVLTVTTAWQAMSCAQQDAQDIFIRGQT